MPTELVKFGWNVASCLEMRFIFCNVAKQTNGWDAGTTDSNGDLTSDGTLHVFESQQTADIQGVWTLSFTGLTASITYPGYCHWNTLSHVYDSVHNVTIIRLSPATSIGGNPYNETQLGFNLIGTQRTAISSTNTGVTNVQVVPPNLVALDGYNPVQEFHPLYLALLIDSTAIRTMDYTGTNDSTIANWSDRIADTFTHFGTAKGGSYESVCRLVNILAAGKATFTLACNIPHMATTDFITSFATLIRTNCAANVKLIFEGSNELWNNGFAQYAYMAAKGATDALVNPSIMYSFVQQNPNLHNTAPYLAMAETSLFTGEIADIVAGIDATAQIMLSVQPNGGTLSNQIQFCNDFSVTKPTTAANSLYPNISLSIDTGTVTVTQIITNLTANVVSIVSQSVNTYNLAISLGLKYFTYEANIALQANNALAHGINGVMVLPYGPWELNLLAKIAAMNDPRMETVLELFLNTFYKALPNERLFIYNLISSRNWADAQYGIWGIYEWEDGITPESQAVYSVRFGDCFFVQSDFDFSDMEPTEVNFQRNFPVTSTAGVAVANWSAINCLTGIDCSLQPITGKRMVDFAIAQLDVSHVAYFNINITTLKNGDRFTDVSGNVYVIQWFELQGGGGADGLSFVFAVYAKLTYQ